MTSKLDDLPWWFRTFVWIAIGVLLFSFVVGVAFIGIEIDLIYTRWLLGGCCDGCDR